MKEESERPEEETIDHETAVPLPTREAMSVVDGGTRLAPLGGLPGVPDGPPTDTPIQIGRTPDGV